MALCALFVGIDAYPKPVRPLQGCVNDISNVCTALNERVSAKHFNAKMLTNEQATRQNVIPRCRGTGLAAVVTQQSRCRAL